MAHATDVDSDKVEAYVSGHHESRCYKYFIGRKGI